MKDRECWTCWETKPLFHFSKDSKIKDKYSHRCKPCVRLYRNKLREDKVKQEEKPLDDYVAPSFKITFD
jgi:hypothetical protein